MNVVISIKSLDSLGWGGGYRVVDNKLLQAGESF